METPESQAHTEEAPAEKRQAEREASSNAASLPETQDWLEEYVGIWREGDGLTLEEVLAKIRAMRDS